MKKLLRRPLALTLVVILLCMSIVMPQNSGLGFGMAQDASAVVGTAIAKAAGTYLLQRSYAEISAFAIANDVPVHGGVAKLMLTPEQRANMKQRAQVEQILESVTEIERSITNMEAQINTVNLRLSTLSKEIAELQASVEHMEWEIIALNQKISQQEAAIALNSSVQSVQEIAGKYKTASMPSASMALRSWTIIPLPCPRVMASLMATPSWRCCPEIPFPPEPRCGSTEKTWASRLPIR